ncbi:MAG TPA: hypothetical protein VF278_12625 [Pirellulales bacterium]
MKRESRALTLSSRDIRYTLVEEQNDVPWGQFDGLTIAAAERTRREGWRRIVDDVLIEWGRNPETVEDDGIDAPTTIAIAGATGVVSRLRGAGMPVPTNVAPTGDGGIAFQYELTDTFLTIEIDLEGAVELRVYRDGDVIRHNLGRPN